MHSIKGKAVEGSYRDLFTETVKVVLCNIETFFMLESHYTIILRNIAVLKHLNREILYLTVEEDESEGEELAGIFTVMKKDKKQQKKVADLDQVDSSLFKHTNKTVDWDKVILLVMGVS